MDRMTRFEKIAPLTYKAGMLPYGWPMLSRRYFPPSIRAEVVGQFNVRKELYGELGMNASASIDLSRISHCVTKMELSHDYVWVTIKIRRDLESFIDSISLYPALRAYGNTKSVDANSIWIDPEWWKHEPEDAKIDLVEDIEVLGLDLDIYQNFPTKTVEMSSTPKKMMEHFQSLGKLP